MGRELTINNITLQITYLVRRADQPKYFIGQIEWIYYPRLNLKLVFLSTGILYQVGTMAAMTSFNDSSIRRSPIAHQQACFQIVLLKEFDCFKNTSRHKFAFH